MTGYRVYRDGTLVATVSNTKWTDGLTFKGALRTYAVIALDAAGNTSLTAQVTVQ